MSASAGLKPEASQGATALLQTLETSLDDLRSLVTCRICVRPLYEPYTIECGHTFCYSCLRQWFDKDRTKITCPDCRSDVIRQPAPAYLVGLVHLVFHVRLTSFSGARDNSDISESGRTCACGRDHRGAPASAAR